MKAISESLYTRGKRGHLFVTLETIEGRGTDLVPYATDTTVTPSIGRDATGAYVVRVDLVFDIDPFSSESVNRLTRAERAVAGGSSGKCGAQQRIPSAMRTTPVRIPHAFNWP